MGIKKLVSGIISGILLCACMLFNVSAEENNDKLRVMPLGDSITDGFWLQGGYRTTLCNMLLDNGYSEKIDFVGPNWGGDCYDPNHAGYSGYSIDNIDQSDSISGGRVGISSFIEQLLSDYPADVVMLQIGTNDILSYYDMENMGVRLEKLVNTIFDKINGGRIYLATIPCMDANNTLYINGYYFTPESMDSAVDRYNEQIKEIAARLKSEGKNIELADINSLLGKEDLFDGVHPTAEGYEKMGRYWYSVLESYINESDNNDIPTTTAGSTEVTTVTSAEETEITTAVPEITSLSGDVNSDGSVNIADLVLMQQYITGVSDDSVIVLENWDMNDDRIFNVYDVIMLKRLLIL